MSVCFLLALLRGQRSCKSLPVGKQGVNCKSTCKYVWRGNTYSWHPEGTNSLIFTFLMGTLGKCLYKELVRHLGE